jgi:hypothetical protein
MVTKKLAPAKKRTLQALKRVNPDFLAGAITGAVGLFITLAFLSVII